jgi:DNA modification methylase
MYCKSENFTLYHGDNRQILPTLAENSVDAIVTDPPYELGFMGKSWDASGVAFDPATWREALRVLKPGGHLIAFSGSRTYHRMAVAIEDAGFEIRDQIMWIYGSGFPKSYNISKGIEGTLTNGSASWNKWHELNGELGEAKGQGANGLTKLNASHGNRPEQYASHGSLQLEPTTLEAKQWEGWGTALKPAHEPMVLARKPLVGTVAANVLTYGTGGLNIDGSRVGSETVVTTNGKGFAGSFEGGENDNGGATHQGRWPANVIHDGSDEVVALFPDKAGGGHWSKTKVTGYGEFGGGKSEYFGQGEKDGFGSAARFFYCAKASKRDRNEGLDGFEVKAPAYESYRENLDAKGGDTPFAGAGRSGIDLKNHHPTVKPTDLMRYLCRLITPPNGTVLDPFMGSGSTGKAAMYEGFKFIGIEMTDEYLPIAKARIEFAVNDNEGFLL